MLVRNQSEVIIENSSFISNRAKTNGPVLATTESGGIQVNISRSRFERNVAEEGNGGALWLIDSKITLKNGVQFISNVADHHGGAIYMNKSLGLNVSDTLFQNNACHLSKGGAIFVLSSNDSVAHVRRSIFKGNSANGVMGMGGAIAFGYTGKHVERALEISGDVLFLKNTARVNGGAVIVYNTKATVCVMSTFVGNSVQGAAGGLQLMFSENHLTEGAVMHVTVKAAHFFNNRAIVHGGGAMFLFGAVHTMVLNSTFIQNSGNNGGVVYSKRATKIEFHNNCQFKQNKASQNGGSLFVRGTEVNITNCSFIGNEGERGGSINAKDGDGDTIHIQDSVFEGNGANDSGGAIHIENLKTSRGQDTRITMVHISFSNNWSSRNENLKGFGGALRLVGPGIAATINASRFEKNTAHWGGSVYLDETFSTTFNGVRFLNNSANLGGALYIIPLERELVSVYDRTTLNRSSLDRNQAHRGGAIFARPNRQIPGELSEPSNSQLIIHNSKFRKNRARDVGGGLFLALMNATFESCFFLKNVAVHNDRKGVEVRDVIHSHLAGGALYASDGSSVTVSKTKFTENKAYGRGGAVCIVDALLNCTNHCTFQKNTGLYGGGIFGALSSANNDSRHQTLLHCTGCLFLANKAQKGGTVFCSVSIVALKLFSLALGGIYASIPITHNVVKESQMNCSNNTSQMVDPWMSVENGSRANVIYLNPLQMQNNSAEITGRSIFTTEPFAVTVVTEKKETKNLVGYVNGTKNENDDVYDFSSIAHTVKNESKSLRDLNRGNTGQELGFLKFRILDYFGQTVNGSRIVVELRDCPNCSLECCSTDRVTDQEKNSSIAMVVASRIASNGRVSFEDLQISDGRSGYRKYPLWACFIDEGEEPASLNPRLVNISFRGCYPMEKRNNETGSCEECDAGQYYEQKNVNDCKVCPDQADCKGLTIIPKQGFWHRTSVSNKIYRCRPKQACTEDKNNSRRDAATNAHKENRTLTFNDTLYNQCKSGYEGLICGSCQENHGRWNHICIKCYDVVVMWFLLLATILWNLLILMVFIYSARSLVNRVHFNQQATAQHQGIQTPVPLMVRQPNQQIQMIPVTSRMLGNASSLQESISLSSASLTVSADVGRQVPQSRSCRRRRQFQETIASDPLPLANPLSEAFKIVLNFMQVVYLAGLLSEDLPGFFNWSIIPFDSLNPIETVFFIADCLLKENADRAVIRMTLQALFPVCLFLLVCLVPTLLLIFKRNIKFGLKDVQLVALCTIYLYFGPETMTLLRFLDRVSISDEDSDFNSSSFWRIDTSVKFFQGSHAYVVGFIVFPLLLALVIVFPSSLFVTLKKHKEQMQEEDVVSIYGFLYKGYEPGYYYWEIVIVIRKTLIAILFVFVHNAELQSMFIALLLAFFLSLQLIVSPFIASFPGLNRLESLSLGVSAIVFWGVALMLQSYDLGETPLFYSIAGVTLFILSATAVVMIIGLYIATQEFLNDKLVESRDCEDKRSAESLPIMKKLYKLAGFYFRRFSSCLIQKSDRQLSANGGVRV
eukprot:g3603.t1